MTTQTSAPAPAPVAVRDTQRRWLALAVIAVAQLMLALDATIVNIALPSAQHALHFDDAARQWVVTAYTLSFAGLLLLGGRIADTLGRRRAFLGALVGFGCASLLGGLAPSSGVLIIGRALQGAFAAVLAPCALSLLAVAFTEPEERAKAFGVYGAVASSGAAIGLLCGGALTEYFDWRWCLYANVVIAAAVLVGGRRVLPAPSRFPGVRIDPVSGLLTTGGLAALVLGSAEAATHAWSSAYVAIPIAGGAAMLAGFVLRQARAVNPLLPLSLLADRTRAGAYLAAAVAVVGAFGLFLLLTYHMQVVLHYSPVRAGLAFLPMVLANSLSGYVIGSRLQTRVQARWLIGGGLLIAAAGLAVLASLRPASGYAAVILPAELLTGLGMGALMPSVFALAIRVAPRDAGVAAALVNTATQLGATLGTALLNTVAVSATAAYAGGGIAALVHGYASATAWAAVALAAAAGLATILIRPNLAPKELAMSVQLNHTIVRVRDKEEAASFFADILGLPPATRYGPFLVLEVANHVSLDFADDHGDPVPTHYAFLVTEAEFDQIFGRIKDRGLDYWADPFHQQPGQVNTKDGGRGVYWDDPNGHALEIITRPYGSGA